ncbi:MAG: right-handed parallel beta-helix repeat-containing protein [Chloroflexi bacterium]|nr:right-handed parallel beta-helix repeat-containing protein [Chloroflexota bacterium]
MAGIILAASACGPDPTPPSVEETREESPPADCTGCLLQERIDSAAPGETINISPGIYTLSGGELLIDKDVVLVGEGPEVTVIQAAISLELAAHRVIRITEGSVVSIAGVTIRYGNEAATTERTLPFHSEAIGMPSSGIVGLYAEFGGGIYNQGTLTLTDSIVTGNSAGGGAGIFNGAKITIKDSSITGNRAVGFGGGIFNGSILIAENIVVADNVAGGGAGIGNWGEASVAGSTVRGNRARGTGGGIKTTVSEQWHWTP